ncbi:MAG: hypothetical protein HKO09_10540 [Croceitalea sp.]|nr:hypothetical protein [Croceitalea sp.]
MQGCQKDGGSENDPTTIEEPNGEEFTPVYFNGIAGTETGNADFPYLVQHENGESLLLTADGETPTGAVYFVDENTTAIVSLNEDLLPEQVSYNNELLILFSNYREDLVDVALIFDDDFQIVRDIEFPNTNNSKFAMASIEKADWAGFFTALGTSLSAAICIGTAAATFVPTLGTSGVAAGIACGGALVGVMTIIRPTDNSAMGATATTAGIAANAYGCASGALSANPLVLALACINSLLDAGALLTGGYEEFLDAITELTQLARGGLQTGDGDVKFTLTWNTDVDLDLYVTEPSGDVIWYGNRYSTTGGELDVDDRDGFGPENIFWPTDFARPGSYRVEVRMYSGNKSTTFKLKPKVGNRFYNTISLGIESSGQIVFVGNYILSASDKGDLVGEWLPPSNSIKSSAINLSLSKQKLKN